MKALIDTNVAIHLRDRDSEILDRIADLAEPPAISIITSVELEGGIAAALPPVRDRRRASLDALIDRIDVIDFDTAAAEAYGKIIAGAGYSRARILDRMIAATAIAHAASLITINGQDFRDVPGLDLVAWPSPAPPAR